MLCLSIYLANRMSPAALDYKLKVFRSLTGSSISESLWEQENNKRLKRKKNHYELLHSLFMTWGKSNTQYNFSWHKHLWKDSNDHSGAMHGSLVSAQDLGACASSPSGCGASRGPCVCVCVCVSLSLTSHHRSDLCVWTHHKLKVAVCII